MAITEGIEEYLSDWNLCKQMTHLVSLDQSKLNNVLQDWRTSMVAQDTDRESVVWL